MYTNHTKLNLWKLKYTYAVQLIKNYIDIKHLGLISVFCLMLITMLFGSISKESMAKIISPLASTFSSLHSIKTNKGNYEVFGFGPWWTFDKLDKVDFKTLTTLAYFDLKIGSDGHIITDDLGYETFRSRKATQLFQKAHENGTRVVATITQMDSDAILALMDDEDAQNIAIHETVDIVKRRGIDGINVDFEYGGNPGNEYRNKFTTFVRKLSKHLKNEIPEAKLSISVYASAVKEPKIYNLADLNPHVDHVFMMAYDFATSGADYAIPTAPLGGYQEGKYWYDIKTSVQDFLTQMPANKLILGTPWYSYDYLVYKPELKAETRPYYSWRGQPEVLTYAKAQEEITPTKLGEKNYKSGWDPYGQVSWKAYYVPETETWRMLFIDDVKSLAVKYDFAKDMNLGGVGMWALGFEDGNTEMWNLLTEKFGLKFVVNSLSKKKINESI